MRLPSVFALAYLVGQSGATPGPVEVEDPRTPDDPFASWGGPCEMTHTRRCGHEHLRTVLLCIKELKT